MKPVIAALVLAGMVSFNDEKDSVSRSTRHRPLAGMVSFNDEKDGSLPAGWAGGCTGKGAPKWAVENGALKQSGEGTFPWCVKQGVALADGFVETRFKPLAGEEDQAGGLVWRWQDGDNYYVARANALEDNVRIYHVTKGARRQFGGKEVKVAGNVWHSLRVDFIGRHFKVTFDGKLLFEADDATIAGPGAVGVWTKADSVTLFDDFQFGAGNGDGR
jgi:hypothetical protein